MPGLLDGIGHTLGALASLPGNAINSYAQTYAAVPQQLADAAQQRQYELQSRQMALKNAQYLQGLLPSLSPQDQLSLLTNAAELGKAYASNDQQTVIKGGETLRNGVTGSTYTAPLMGVDNGRAYTQGPNSFNVTGTTGPQVDPTTGVDKTTGYQFNVNTPHEVAPGAHLDVFNTGGQTQNAPLGSGPINPNPSPVAPLSAPNLMQGLNLPQPQGQPGRAQGGPQLPQMPQASPQAGPPLPPGLQAPSMRPGAHAVSGGGMPGSGGVSAPGGPAGSFQIPGKPGLFQRDYMGQVHDIPGTGLTPDETGFLGEEGKAGAATINAALDARPLALQGLASAKQAIAYVNANAASMNPSAAWLTAGANYLRALPPAVIKAAGGDPAHIDATANNAQMFHQLAQKEVFDYAHANLPSRFTEREIGLVTKVTPQLTSAPDAAAFYFGLKGAKANTDIARADFAANYQGPHTKQAIEKAWQESPQGRMSMFQDPIWQNIQLGGQPAVVKHTYKGRTVGIVGAGTHQPTVFDWVQ